MRKLVMLWAMIAGLWASNCAAESFTNPWFTIKVTAEVRKGVRAEEGLKDILAAARMKQGLEMALFVDRQTFEFRGDPVTMVALDLQDEPLGSAVSKLCRAAGMFLLLEDEKLTFFPKEKKPQVYSEIVIVDAALRARMEKVIGTGRDVEKFIDSPQRISGTDDKITMDHRREMIVVTGTERFQALVRAKLE